ncbi:hypothetical protein PCASD_00558 [Puccinia coronata f. sp. avenae]|uniref:Uncharacterized protein n=1 Tax=Puccinia coronata f. sp. avenae TaxID=200324 RepID=A0A2N5VNY0_9BASI|nr:hypothetical protein PCASD_00558 [Puccinia coronata f. sp. avenae]
MAASKFLSDAAIQFKLGRAPPSELLTHSNSAARAFGHQCGHIGQSSARVQENPGQAALHGVMKLRPYSS